MFTSYEWWTLKLMLRIISVWYVRSMMANVKTPQKGNNYDIILDLLSAYVLTYVRTYLRSCLRTSLRTYFRCHTRHDIWYTLHECKRVPGMILYAHVPLKHTTQLGQMICMICMICPHSTWSRSAGEDRYIPDLYDLYSSCWVRSV